MTKSGFSYLKLTAVVAVLAIAIIGLAGLLSTTTVAREKRTTTPREIDSTLDEKFSARAATLVATTGDTTTTTVPAPLFNLGGVQITAINLDEGALVDKVEIGWSFTMPSELATLGSCVVLDHFDVEVEVIRDAFGNVANRKTRSEKASALARNAVVRFSDVGRKVLIVNAKVTAVYNFACRSEHSLNKRFSGG